MIIFHRLLKINEYISNFFCLIIYLKAVNVENERCGELLTFPAVNLQVCGGQIVVHVMLVDLFKEALPLPQL